VSESRRDAAEAHRQSDDNKDHFLAVLAHELRNPLGALKNAVKVAQLAGDQPLPRDRALEVMSRQITQMEWLIEDLIDANRVARGELKLQLRRIELQPILELALETVMPQFRQKQQTVSVAMPADEIYLNADSMRVTQMVTNLLNNACKFTGARGTIALEVNADGAAVAIHVRDSGVGLAAEDRDGIFKMFGQKNAGGGDRHTGLGIGLALVKDLATLHGGSVEAHSAGLGQGSEFILRLPTTA
jgi:signal transduction histidine kinase